MAFNGKFDGNFMGFNQPPNGAFFMGAIMGLSIEKECFASFNPPKWQYNGISNLSNQT